MLNAWMYVPLTFWEVGPSSEEHESEQRVSAKQRLVQNVLLPFRLYDNVDDMSDLH